MSSADDHRHMAAALRLAEKGRRTTHPNPRVGCLIVRDGEVVGEGWHRMAGEPHAERIALEAAGDAARGATLYVNLEPCCHEGRTGPCTDAIIEAGIARVVVAMTDPNPRVSGDGAASLEESGVEVETGLMEGQARELNVGFVSRMERGRPWVRAKLAVSLDGRTALASGASRWITGEPAREDVQRLRAEASAVMTGIGTVIADDPRLDVRLDGTERQPLRVVLDAALKVSPEARILAPPGEAMVLTASPDTGRRQALEAVGARVGLIEANAEGRVTLEAALERLAELEMNEVLLEAGSTLNGAMLHAGLLDELIVYQAPVILGDEGRGMFRMAETERMEDAVRVTRTDTRRFGDDLRHTFLLGER